MSETPAILIVDDQEKLLKLVVLLMNRIGFPDVEGVTDAVTALERMRQRRYALVISDLDMEPMDGLSFLREIRADDALMNTPFLLTEASFDFEDINLAHQAGADAFILKPFDMSVLKAKLKQVINRKPRRREAPLA
ncbi:response regulator, partial [Methylobacterium sp.]|uniref:response regulator n=1 Tax=Methylobacterium sp. TaxID=409 RepID=UPI002632F03E